jgi:hypothetical protein
MAFGLSSALLVFGCGGPEYRPSASAEANQSQKPAPANSKNPIEIATGGQQAAAEKACDEAIAAATAAARATGSRRLAATQSDTPAIAPVGTAQDGTAGSEKTGAFVPRSSSSATITCNGKTYQVPASVQPTGQPQQPKPVVQMPLTK